MSASDRIQWLHQRICDNRYPNAKRLAERFGISHRQAQRDVEALRERFGAPLCYSAEQRGFYYTEDYSLPTYLQDANSKDYVETLTGAEHHSAKREIIQLQIPYSALLAIPDKLTCLELKDFIVRQDSPGRYVCEFHSVELFLGLLFTTAADVTILKPEWLREQMLRAAERALKNNTLPPEEDE